VKPIRYWPPIGGFLLHYSAIHVQTMRFWYSLPLVVHTALAALLCNAWLQTTDSTALAGATLPVVHCGWLWLPVTY
jgi:hypothetical protein